MINKRLIGLVGESKKYVIGNVICQWISLLMNIVMMVMVASLLDALYKGVLDQMMIIRMIGLIVLVMVVRSVCMYCSSRLGYLSSKSVKVTLREMIYGKLLRLGNKYREYVQTSEITQVFVEGIEQLDTYFGAYLPQFFYAMIAPLTLFVVVSFIDLWSALVLFICVPLIPVTIILIQKWAKKLLNQYWSQYTSLGDTFLENLQGLTTTKIYQTDGYKHKQMNEQSEKFRKITMKVLSMQLNSITIMDLIAYGGAALGIIIAIIQLKQGNVTFKGALIILLLAADFFLPMRLLGSYFHIAMNGMAAADKIFRILDIDDMKVKTQDIDQYDIEIKDMSFGYDSKPILKHLNMNIPQGSFVAFVGESGCGKSTLAHLLMGQYVCSDGDIMIGHQSLNDINEDYLMKHITYLGHQSYLFKGTVRENLLMGDEYASDDVLWDVLDQVNLGAFLREENGLDTLLLENASNLSGGQKQRLAIARALLHDSDIYIFDEATSNIDVESENEIMHQIQLLAQTKTVILISHRLAHVTSVDHIYVLKDGMIVEEGTHKQLLQQEQVYASLWNVQQELEDIRR